VAEKRCSAITTLRPKQYDFKAKWECHSCTDGFEMLLIEPEEVFILVGEAEQTVIIAAGFYSML
jgi:hypothetical protein